MSALVPGMSGNMASTWKKWPPPICSRVARLQLGRQDVHPCRSRRRHLAGSRPSAGERWPYGQGGPLVAPSSTGGLGMTGAEEVVISRQLEVGDAAKVRTVLGDW